MRRMLRFLYKKRRKKMLYVKRSDETPLPTPPIDAAAPARTETATFALG